MCVPGFGAEIPYCKGNVTKAITAGDNRNFTFGVDGMKFQPGKADAQEQEPHLPDCNKLIKWSWVLIDQWRHCSRTSIVGVARVTVGRHSQNFY